jgi:hypothetical protein
VIPIERIASMRDKPAFSVKDDVKLQLLSKEQFKEPLQEAPSGLLENDLVLKVDDPAGSVFSFGLVTPDGKEIGSSLSSIRQGSKARLVQLVNYGPLPPHAVLRVNLKTAKAYVEVPFRLANVQLP